MPQELDDSQWWLDDRLWLDLFEPLFNEDENLADHAAKLFHHLLAEIESGPQGATRVAWCLENALRLTFPFTKTYHACRVLFEVSFGKNFPPNLDTMALLTEAIKRTKAGLQRASKSQSKGRRKHSRR